MSLIGLVITIVILGLLCYLIQVLPIPQPFKTVCWILLVIIAILYLIGYIPLGVR